MTRLFALFAAVLLLQGCSAEKFLNAFVPDDGYRFVRDVAYGTEPRQKLDIYIPDRIKTPGCTILFYPGGGWTSGERSLYKFAGQAFASQGCIAVIADYRLYPAVQYPVFVQDTAAAFVWVHGNIARYGGNPDRIFIAGHSAGAYNIAMIAAHPSFLKDAGGKKDWIRGVIGIAGPYDFKPSEEDPDIKAAFSTETDVKAMPVTYVTAGMPPMMLASGQNDRRVKVRNTASMAAALRKHGNEVHEVLYPYASHMAIVLSLMVNNRAKIPLLKDIMEFVDSH